MIIDFHKIRYKWLEVTKDNLTIYVHGTIFKNNIKLSNEDLINLIIDCDLNKLFSDLNGFFTVVIIKEGNVNIVSDRVRLFPLWYEITNNKLIISDEITKLNISNSEIDEISSLEFQMSGYVCGKRTLLKNIFQTQAGQILNVNNCKEKSCNYYQFGHSELEKFSKDDFFGYAHKKFLNSIKRLISYADGRQIVIPLSGGYDSRLILYYLKLLGYKNIFTFSYGEANNIEVSIAKKIAVSLKVQWKYITYSKKEWIDITDIRREYEVYSSSFSSQSHVQDFLAIYKLKDQQLIDKDAVISPGHSFDMQAGNHLPKDILNYESYSKEILLSKIYARHFNIDPILMRKKEKFIIDKLNKDNIISSKLNQRSFASYFELWDWKERQTKFICNAVRIYDYFEYDYWLPLWDNDCLEICSKVPLENRINRLWFTDFVDDYLVKKMSTYNVPRKYTTDPLLLMRLNSIANKFYLLRPLRFLRFIFRQSFNRNYSIVKESYFVLTGIKPKFIIGYLLKGFEAVGIYNKFIYKSIINLLKKHEIK